MAAQPQLLSVQDHWDADRLPWVRTPTGTDFPVVDSLRAAPWKVIDVETTGLTIGSAPVSLTKKKRQQGADEDLRLRVVSALWPENGQIRMESFDMDMFWQDAPEWVEPICTAALSRVVVAHNAGFDTAWLRQHSTQMPDRLLDTMLIGRILRPKLPLEIIQKASEALGEATTNPVAAELLKSVYGEKSGWALADMTALLLNTVMPKGLQKPENWTPFYLTREHYQYALGDVIRTYQILAVLLGLFPEGDPDRMEYVPILKAYKQACREHPELARQEPQVLDLIPIREKGMPHDVEQMHRFVASQKQVVAEQAALLVQLEPDLQPFEADLADWDAGISAKLKEALGQTFVKHGLYVQTTDKTSAYKIGEKDLRLVGAEDNAEVKDLYTAWVTLNKAKKTGKMAEEVGEFAKRSPDHRIHPLLGHGPATGRLSSAEPNAQQYPSLSEFRAMVASDKPGYKICAVDYSALDMRSGAALALRAQREIALATSTGFHNGIALEESLLKLLRAIDTARQLDLKAPPAVSQPWGGSQSPVSANLTQLGKKYQDLLKRKEAEMAKLRETDPQDLGKAERSKYWDTYRLLKASITKGQFANRWVEVLINAQAEGTTDWSALRNVFRMNLDVHTATTLRMRNQSPEKLFGKLSGAELEEAQKKVKHELGDARKGGKVANLGLLYYMQVKGFQTYAAKLFNIHWTFEETAEIRTSWLNSYPEIDLWALWTMLNPVSKAYVPDGSKRSGFRAEDVYKAETLGGRVMYPLGLNAGLAYGDQGTGADILGEVVHELRINYPHLYACAINQVHDEMVFELPGKHAEAWANQLGEIMDECANRFLMPYGVPSACTPALADVWVKD